MTDEHVRDLQRRVTRLENTLSRLALIRRVPQQNKLQELEKILCSFDSEIRRERRPYNPPPGAELRRIEPDGE